MTECLYDMDLASLMETSQDTKQAFSKMEMLWDLFLKKKKITRSDLRPSIMKSWERCLDFDINPLCHKPHQLNMSEVEQRVLKKEAYTEVIRSVVASMEHLTDLSHYIVAFADDRGYILMLYGNKRLKDEVASLNFKVGANWSEKHAGTNAIGSAIATARPSQVFHAEHFLRRLHHYTCTAVPIMDPFTNKLMGVIDFASRSEHYQPHTLGLAIQMSRCIELEIYRKEKEKEAFFREQSLAMTLDHMDRGVIVTDNKDCIRRVNLKTLEYLNFKIDQLIYHPFNEVLIFSQWKNHNSPFYLNFSNGKSLCLTRKPLIHQGRAIGFLVILEPMNLNQVVSKKPLYGEGIKPVGQSPAFKKALEIADHAACCDSNLLITGETGTGKEVMARYIHQSSLRNSKPFIAINCGSIPKELLGSELFGYHAGAFTGASKKGHLSKFEQANQGTLLLDEISEMPLEAQVYLLRVLEERAVTRIGGVRHIPVDVRVITVSNKDLSEQIKKGQFRADLFYRLNVLSITMPSLNERASDIPYLVQFFLESLSDKMNRPTYSVSSDAMALLMSYDWPGNIRELRNILENAIVLSPTHVIGYDFLSKTLIRHKPVLRSLSAKERLRYQNFVTIYKKHNGNITQVAKTLHVTRPTVYSWLKKYKMS